MNSKLPRVLLVCFWWTMLLVAPPAYSQATDGNVVGTITDSTGAGVPNANVEVENMATGLKLTGRSTDEGVYRFNNLLVGRYKVTASAPGFAPASVQNVSIELNKTTTANLTIAVGTVQTTVEVIEAPALIDTTTAQITTTYERKEAVDIPTTSQDSGILNLSLLSAGVTSAGGYGLGEGPLIGGQRPRQNNSR
jgi:hypothetical protein